MTISSPRPALQDSSSTLVFERIGDDVAIALFVKRDRRSAQQFARQARKRMTFLIFRPLESMARTSMRYVRPFSRIAVRSRSFKRTPLALGAS